MGLQATASKRLKAAQAEIEAIRLELGGSVRAQEIVEWARLHPESALHGCFEWDDSRAAESYRIEQARRLLRVAVTMHEPSREVIRAYVSLTPDRADGTGYRAAVDILGDREMTAQMVTDALRELSTFQRKYAALRHVAELEGVFVAIEALGTLKTG